MKGCFAVIVSAVALAVGVQCIRFEQENRVHVGSIDKVVTMLKDMLKNSEDEWKADKEAYTKFKSYCDENEEKKTTAVLDAKKDIALLENKIEGIQGKTGGLSVSAAELKSEMADNEKAREDAKAVREKENKAYTAEKEDLDAAISTLDEAIQVLADIGADQTMAENADHAQFMGKYKEVSLASVRSSVREALVAASSFLEPAQKKQMQAFVQAPFTGTYTAQSAEIIGILKDMKSTFETDVATATAREEKAKEAYDKFKKTKEEEFDEMKASYDDKQSSMGTNDGELASKKTQLETLQKQKEEDEDFLEKLGVQCVDKSKEYKTRKTFAENEQVALQKAIAILDNDVASEKFAAKFIQLSAKRHSTSHSPRAEATQILEKANKGRSSARLAKVVSLLQSGNPFTIILEQIDKMVKLLDEEQTVDDNEKAWCEKTNEEQKQNLDDKTDELTTIQDDIKKLNTEIDDPSSGLKKQIAGAEDSLKTNLENQAEETKTRRSDNLEYQKDVGTMSDAISLITQAEQTLTDYYDSLDNEQLGLIQEEPKAPETWEGSYKGQNEQAKTVLKLLADVKKSTTDEANTEHENESKAQSDYEDSMEALTKEEAELQESIAKLNKELTTKEKELEAKYEEETSTEKEKIAIERYIEKIKPGCDFITGKYSDRKTARSAEKTALEGAKTKLEGSPSFKLAQQKDKEDGFGECKETCLKDESDVECKACLAGVSVPGYCAGHKDAKGC
jgi:hypothetical protein